MEMMKSETSTRDYGREREMEYGRDLGLGYRQRCEGYGWKRGIEGIFARHVRLAWYGVGIFGS